MNMIYNQIKELRELADELAMHYSDKDSGVVTQAADAIESLSAKLFEANKEIENLNAIQEVAEEIAENMKWIPCKERLPEEKINPITRDFFEYQVTFQSDDVKDIRHYKFGNGHWWNAPGIMDEYVTAWRENPEPYHET